MQQDELQGLSAVAAPSPPRSGYAGAVPSVVRALALLERLRDAPHGATLAALSRGLAVSPSSLLAILRTLAAAGYVERTDDRYRPGPALAAVAGASTASAAVRDAADAVAALAQAAARAAAPGSAITGEAAALQALGLAARELSAVLLGGAAATPAAPSTLADREPVWRPEASGPLDPTELDAFLRGGWLATLSCLKRNGYPYSVPVWYHWEHARFWVVPRARAEWARYLVLDPRVSLAIGEPRAPFRRALVEGRAERVEGPDAVARARNVSALMAERYLGPGAGPYLETVAAAQQQLFAIAAEKLVTWRGLAPHPRYRSARPEAVGGTGAA